MGKKVLKVEKLISENGIIELETGTQIIGGSFQQSTQWGAGTVNTDIHYSSGDVGIGTNDPRFTLDVNGTANVGVLTTTSVSGDGSGLTGILTSAIPNLNQSQWTTSGNDVYIDNNSISVGIGKTPTTTLDVLGTVKATTMRATTIVGEGSGITNIQATNIAGLTNSQWTGATNGINYSGGRVGVGTSTPGFTLDVNGTANVGALTATTISGNGSGLTGIPASAVVGGVGVWTQPGNDAYYTTGRVSIGTTTADANLHVEGNVYVSSNLEVGTANLFVDTSTSNVGIRTSTPGYTLDVNGDINLTGDFYQDGSPFVSSLWELDGGDLTYTASNVEIGTANLFVDTLHSNVGIGTATPLEKLHVIGAVKATSFIGIQVSDIPDLSASKITSGEFNAFRIPNLPASKITSGTFPPTQIPLLDASKITSGTFLQARIPLLSGVTGVFDPNVDAIKIGNGAGTTSQGTGTVAVGHDAGTTSQGSRGVAIGKEAAMYSQGTEAVAIGGGAGRNTQGISAIAIGYEASSNVQGHSAIAIGYWAAADGATSQGSNSIAIGKESAFAGQGTSAIAMGYRSGKTTQGTSAIAMGYQSGFTSQGAQSVAIGFESGKTNQGARAVAIGKLAGQTNQHDNSIILNASGSALNSTSASSFYVKPIRTATEVSNVVTYNSTSGEVLDCNTVTINTLGHITAVKFLGDGSALQNLPSAGYNPAVDDIKIGNGAGTTSQGADGVAIGHDAATTSQGTKSVAIGNLAATTSQGTRSVAVGYAAGWNTQGDNAVAIGNHAAQNTQGYGTVTVGYKSGQQGQGAQAVAIGMEAGNSGQTSNAVAIGFESGKTNQGSEAVAIGQGAGTASQGSKAIAIGNLAGQTSQAANSIVINATGVAVNNTTVSSCVIQPVRGGNIGGSALAYTSTGEIVEETNIHFDSSGNVGIGKVSPDTTLDVVGTGTFSGGLITNTGQVGKKTYSYAGSLIQTQTIANSTIKITFTPHVFYAKIVAHLVESPNEVSTLSLECGGGHRSGLTPLDITVGSLSIFGSASSNPWDTTITTSTTEVSFKPFTSMAVAGDYNVFIEYISAHVDGKVVKITEGPTIDRITFGY